MIISQSPRGKLLFCSIYNTLKDFFIKFFQLFMVLKNIYLIREINALGITIGMYIELWLKNKSNFKMGWGKKTVNS